MKKDYNIVMSLNVANEIEAARDPLKVIDKYLHELVGLMPQVNREAELADIEEKKMRAQVKELQAKMDKYEMLTQKAFAANAPKDAQVFMNRKAMYEDDYVDLRRLYNTVKENTDRIKAVHDKIIEDVRELVAYQKNYSSKRAAAYAKKKLYTKEDELNIELAKKTIKEKTDRQAYEADALEKLSHDDFLYEELEKKYADDDEEIDDYQVSSM